MLQLLVRRRPCSRIAGALLALAVFLACAGIRQFAHAQVPDLSTIDRRVKEGVKDQQKRKIPPATPRLAAPTPAAAPPLQPFTLSGVVIEGATVFAPADLTGSYEAYLLKPVGDAEIELDPQENH